jgi:hypothetical protein
MITPITAYLDHDTGKIYKSYREAAEAAARKKLLGIISKYGNFNDDLLNDMLDMMLDEEFGILIADAIIEAHRKEPANEPS